MVELGILTVTGTLKSTRYWLNLEGDGNAGI
jgi:hypothetical protein